MKKKKTKTNLVFVGVLIVVISSLMLNMQTVRGDSEPSLTITTAYYCDIDNDGLEDDVYAEAELNTLRDRYLMVMNYELVYPSGNTFEDDYLEYKRYPAITIYFRIINGAPESGWYTLNVDIDIYGSGSHLQLFATLDFDPPGGDGNDPGSGDITTDP